MIRSSKAASFILALVSSVTTLAAFATAAPVAAQTGNTFRDAIAEACAASDADLVGKRLERECRMVLRGQAQAGQTRLNWSRQGRTVELSLNGKGDTVKLAAVR